MKSKNKRHARVGVEKGYGPRHAFNAQEGTEAVPSELPTPPTPAPDLGDKLRRMLIDQVVSPQQRAEMAANPLGLKALASYAGLAGIALGGGEEAPLGEPGAVPLKTWASWKTVKGGVGEGTIKVDPAGNHYQALGGHSAVDPESGLETHHAIVKPVEAPGTQASDPQFPSLDKPPYDALKEPPNKPFADNPRLQDQYEKWLEISQQPQLSPNEEPPNPPLAAPGSDLHFPRFGKGKAKIGVAKGFGPRHAENSAEGMEPALTRAGGSTDTVPAMLTPREAVLNRNAAELAGRGKIEQLNAEGNQLASKGVDLAAKGNGDVGLHGDQAGQPSLPLRPGGETSALIQWIKENPDDPDAKMLEKALRGQDPDFMAAVGAVSVPVPKVLAPRVTGTGNVMKYVLPGEERRQALVGIPKGVQKGTSDMKSKAMKPKPKSFSKPAVPQSGSPYAQGFNAISGQAPQLSPQQIAQLPPPPQPTQPPQGFQGGGQVPGGIPSQNPLYSTSGGVGVMPPAQMPPYNTGGVPMPPSYGVRPMPGPRSAPLAQPRGGFYPPGMGFAEGTGSVPGIGAPNPSTAYDPRAEVDYKAPNMDGFYNAIKEEARKQGISQTQMAQIAQQFSGMGQGGGGAPGGGSLPYDQLGGQYANFNVTQNATPFTGYQGGISDIGYPPMISPGAEYHADKGSTWVGPYDPAFLVQRYARGTSNVPFR